MKIKWIIAIATIFCLCSCESVDKTDIREIEVSLEHVKEIPSSFYDMISEVEFYPLENNINAMLSFVCKFETTEKGIYILDVGSNTKLHLFNNDGSYIRTIGKIGHGRGEYQTIRDFAVNPSGDSVVIATWNSVLLYNSKGEFINEKEVIEKGYITQIQYFNGEFVFATDYSGSEKMLHFVDKNLNVTKEIIDTKNISIGMPAIMNNKFGIDDSSLYYCDFFDSSIYKIGKEDHTDYIKYHFSSKNSFSTDMFEKNQREVYSNPFDAITTFTLIDGNIMGDITLGNSLKPFVFDVNKCNICFYNDKEWISGVKYNNKGVFYRIISQSEFIDITNNSQLLTKLLQKNNNYNIIKDSINEKSNFVIVELKKKK